MGAADKNRTLSDFSASVEDGGRSGLRVLVSTSIIEASRVIQNKSETPAVAGFTTSATAAFFGFDRSCVAFLRAKQYRTDASCGLVTSGESFLSRVVSSRAAV